ncbi:CYTH domain-containing protein [Patescibacteria group bacterium]
MKQIEIEKVFLLKKLPSDIYKYPHKVIQVGDFYDSNSVNALKIRRKGDKYELIKKEANSIHNRTEHTINIKKEEFDVLIQATVQNHKKQRYFYKLGDYTCEIDLYQDKLLGYARAEVEFENEEEMKKFNPPDWFAEEITDINHEIHEDLGIVTFEEMKKRYAEKGINLITILNN